MERDGDSRLSRAESAVRVDNREFRWPGKGKRVRLHLKRGKKWEIREGIVFEPHLWHCVFQTGSYRTTVERRAVECGLAIVEVLDE